MTVDLARLVGASTLGDSLLRLRTAVLPRREVPGWATVELDRAEASMSTTAGRPLQVVPGGDAVLDASARHLHLADGQQVVLLEPSTEGRLAAALARHGEGVLVRYLLVDTAALARAREAGFLLGAASPGPFGSERMVLGGPRWGPFLILAGWD